MATTGRKPQGPYADKGSVFSARIRSDTRQAIEDAAHKSGRSLAQEIEHRLRRSFDDDRAISQRFGSRETYAIARLIGLAVEIERGSEPGTWLNDVRLFDQTMTAIDALMKQMRPAGARPMRPATAPVSSEIGISWQRAFEVVRDSSGLQTASMIIAELRGASFGLPLVRDEQPKRSRGSRAPSRAERIERWKKDIHWLRSDLGSLTDRFNAEAARDELLQHEAEAGKRFDAARRWDQPKSSRKRNLK